MTNAASANNLANHFLMAMPGMNDPNFENAVVVLAEHSEEGALGLVVNRLADMSLKRLFDSVDLELKAPMADRPVLDGGPVHSDRGFVLHENWDVCDSSIPVGDDMTLTSSRDILEALSQGHGPDQFLVALGCASWGPGQLEKEMAANVWLTMPVDSGIVFSAPVEDRFHLAYARLGIDPALMSGAVGHA